ncbi:MAG: DUF2088 domain-containing protein [Dehalococcoidia bacterium]|nr:DUF2088 domain-containing protein [Dehalococcoidia bacterium]
MRASIPYETAEERGVFLELDIAEKNVLKTFAPREPGAIEDPCQAVMKAIDSPVAGRSFEELVSQGKKVVFVTENQFRAAPAELALPALVERARNAGASVSVVIANGKVPPLSDDEIRNRVGAEVVESGVPVVCNEAGNPSRYAYVGTTAAGTPLWVLKEITEADAVITISTTQATLWGYGGSGMVIPGVASNETIETNHVMALAPNCRPGNNNCSMQKDKYEALQMAHVAMGINVIVNNSWEVIYVNAGSPVESHRRAVEHYDSIYRFDIRDMNEKADIVITGSSAPTDHLFFHTNWAIVNCLPVSKEGATIIQATPCPGYGDWPGFALMDLMKDFMPPSGENHEKALRSFFTRERELWAGCIWYPLYKAMLSRQVKIVTMEKNLADARATGIDAGDSLQGAFHAAMEHHGPGAKVAVVPFGRYTVFTE